MALVGAISGSSGLVAITGSVVIGDAADSGYPSIADTGDTVFFVSGALGGRSAGTGVSTFGGDLVTSGTMWVSGTIKSLNTSDSSLDFEPTGLGDGGFRLKAGGVHILSRDASGTPDSISINGDGDAISFVAKVNNKFAFGSTHSNNVTFLNSDTANEAGGDVSTWISGGLGVYGSSTRGVGVFSGDVVISGGIHGGGSSAGVSPLQIGQYRSDLGSDVTTLFVANKGGNGKALFDGDIHVSGTVTTQNGLSGSLTKLSDGSSAFIAGSNITITSASNGAVTIASSGGGGSPGGADTEVQFNDGGASFGGENTFTFNKTTNTLTSTNLTGSLTKLADGTSYLRAGANVSLTSESNGAVTIAYSGGAGSSQWTDEGDILRPGDSTGEQAGFGSTGNNPNAYPTLIGSASIKTTGFITASLGLSGSLTRLTDGTSYLIAGSNVTITSESNGAVTIAASGGGGSVDGSGAVNRIATWSDTDTLTSDADLSWNGATLDVQGEANLNGTVVINQSGVDKDFRVETSNKTAAIQTDGSTDQVMILSGTTADTAGVGSSPQDPDPRTFTDTNLFVSGAIGSRGTGRKGTAVFGGDVVISGSINGGSPLQIGGYREDLGTDVTTLFVSSDGGNSKVLFDGDVYSSGSVTVATGLSGSLTRLTDGTSYLKAGSNVTITSESNGSVTIAASAGGGTPGGADTEVQFNDGGSFGGEGTFTFNKTTNTLTATNLTGSLTRLADGSSYLRAGAGIDITSESNGSITVVATGGSEWADGGSYLYPADSSGVEHVVIGGNSLVNADILLGSAGGAEFNKQQQAGSDFTVSTSGKQKAIFVDGGTDQVLILSGGAAVDVDASAALDVGFFVSGSAGSMGTSARGTSVFGGDLVVSGALKVGNEHTLVVDEENNRVGIGVDTPNAKVNISSNNAGETVLSIEQHCDAVDAPNFEFVRSRGTYDTPVIVNSGDFLGDVQFKAWDGNSEDQWAGFYVESYGTVSNASHPGRFVFRSCADGSTSLSNMLVMQADKIALMESTANISDPEINVFVSGSVGSRGTGNTGTSLFGGDVIVSGSLYARQQEFVTTAYIDSSGAGKEYIPWGFSTSEQAAPNYLNMRLCPYGGRLLKVLLRTSTGTGTGTTVVGFHKGSNGDATISTVASDTSTVNMSSDDTAYEFNFGGFNSQFAAGDIIGISVDPTNNHGTMNVTIVLENWLYDGI